MISGRHSGFLCEVLAVEPRVEGRSERATVRLEPSHEAVSVRFNELGEKWEKLAEAEKRIGAASERRSDKLERKREEVHKHEQDR